MKALLTILSAESADGDATDGTAVRASDERHEMAGHRLKPRPVFLDRVLRTTLYLSGFVAWVMLSLGRNREAASFLIGAAIGLGMLWTMRYAVAQTMTRKRVGWKKKAFAAALAAGKYGIAGVIIWWFVRWPLASPPAFVGGVAMTQAVLLLKALGTTLSPADRKDPYST